MQEMKLLLQELLNTLSKQDGYAYNIVSLYLKDEVDKNWTIYQLQDRIDSLELAKKYVIKAINIVKQD